MSGPASRAALTVRPTPRAAERALVLGALTGLAGDALLGEAPLGPGLAVWMLVLAASASLLLRRRPVVAWGAVAVAAAAGTAWRAAPPLRLLFLVVLVLAAAAVLLEARDRGFGRGRVGDHVGALLMVPALSAAGAAILLLRARLPRAAAGGTRATALGRGVLLALPPLVVFTALFAAADPVFEQAVTRLAAFGSDNLPRHIVLTLVFGWIAAGLLGGLVPERRRVPWRGVRLPRIGIEETSVVLGLVAVLFAGFVALQVSYLFGGRAFVESATGLTLAEYARRGFFELVAVAGLVLTLLLVLDAVAPRGPGRWVFRSLAGVLVALVMVIIASAAYRLRLYTAEFGLTTDRLYGAAFLAWLAATPVWFAATVLRGPARPFASGAHVLTVAAVFGLALLNPDATVARINLDRDSDRPVDAAYLTTLSADAAPVVLSRLDRLDPGARCAAAERLERWTRPVRPDDWRVWNAARSRAQAAAAEAAPGLAAIRARCP